MLFGQKLPVFIGWVNVIGSKLMTVTKDGFVLPYAGLESGGFIEGIEVDLIKVADTIALKHVHFLN